MTMTLTKKKDDGATKRNQGESRNRTISLSFVAIKDDEVGDEKTEDRVSRLV